MSDRGTYCPRCISDAEFASLPMDATRPIPVVCPSCDKPRGVIPSWYLSEDEED